MMRCLLLALVGLFHVNIIRSQAHVLGFNNPHLPLTTFTNPAFIPQFGVSVGFGTSLGLYYPNFNLGDFFSKSTSIQSGLDSFLATPGKDLKDIEIENRLNLLNIGIRSRRAYVGLNTSLVTKVSMSVDKDLLGFVYYGNDENSPYFGKRMELDFANNTGTVVWENRFSYGRIVNKWLNLGFVLTNHTGLYRYDVKQAQFGLYTDTSNEDIYQWKADGVWDIQTNGIGLLNPMMPMDFVNAGPFINWGQSAGFGILIKPSPRWRISGSVNNYGSISWGYMTYNHQLNLKSWNFNGFDTGVLKANQDYTNTLTDSLNKYLSYNSDLDLRWYYNIAFNPQYYVGLEYHITPRDRLFFQYSKGNGVKQNQDFWAIQTQNQLGKSFDIMASYAKYNLSAKQDLIGLGFSLHWRHYQFYALANNVKGLIELDKSQYHSVDFGLNFNFTENHDSDGDDVPDHKDNCKDLYGNARYRGCPDFISSTPYVYDPNYRKLKRLEVYDDRFETKNRKGKRKKNQWQF